MSDLKIFRINGTEVVQLPSSSVELEKSLQAAFETNLETLLGIRFLASEFTIHGGRMDTLGIDENGRLS